MTFDPDLVRWLLESPQPSVRLRTLTELLDRPPDDSEVQAARGQLATSGWGQRILADQLPEGQWVSPGTTAPQLYLPKYVSTMFRLLVLSDLGLTRELPGVATAVELLWVREGGESGGLGGTGSEVCFTGNALRMFSRFGYERDPRLLPMIDWLTSAQKSDGGWHCFPSETGTLDGWEALAGFAAYPRELWTPAIRSSVELGARFYLERGLLHEGTPGAPVYPPWTRLHYPVHYYYDVLVGLDTLSRLGFGRDDRLGPALDLLETKRDRNGRWSIEAVHPDIPEGEEYQPATPVYPFELELSGQPSRWVTITALSVLRAADRA